MPRRVGHYGRFKRPLDIPGSRMDFGPALAGSEDSSSSPSLPSHLRIHRPQAFGVARYIVDPTPLLMTSIGRMGDAIHALASHCGWDASAYSVLDPTDSSQWGVHLLARDLTSNVTASEVRQVLSESMEALTNRADRIPAYLGAVTVTPQSGGRGECWTQLSIRIISHEIGKERRRQNEVWQRCARMSLYPPTTPFFVFAKTPHIEDYQQIVLGQVLQDKIFEPQMAPEMTPKGVPVTFGPAVPYNNVNFDDVPPVEY